MSPRDAAVEETRAAWCKLASDAPKFLRDQLRRDYDDACARRAAYWSPCVVVVGLEGELIERSPMLPGYVAPDVRWLDDAGLTGARESAIEARDTADSAARASERLMYATREALKAAIVAYSAAFVAARTDAAAYSNAADTSCAYGDEVNRRVRGLNEQIGGLVALRCAS